ncbi:unnamed protein product [Clonostachys rosea f. rosea IK726]|uniref:Uncharacterized protein n=2 Tax=Bionectria ochroleuca TaxID=29856 RepID=A0A0B7JW52_BIOOC|nr:unnamed protein product [Clonostachys rosea f. rosea IK726]
MDPARGSMSSEAATSANNLATVPRIRYQTAELLTQEIYRTQRTQGDILYVEDVSPQDFSAIEKFREDHNRKYQFRRFYPERRLLVIAMPTKCHEAMGSTLYNNIHQRIHKMGLENHWNSTRGATYGQEGDGCVGLGEGDSSGHPIQPGVRSWRDWPTLVVEAGCSQSLQHLRDDMGWWFKESNHQVKIVLLIKFHPGPLEEITIEQWRERPIGSSSVQLELTCQQVVNIARNSATANRTLPLSYTVTGGALELRFPDLFLRDPGEGEGDIVIEVERLQWLAAMVGHSMF